MPKSPIRIACTIVSTTLGIFVEQNRLAGVNLFDAGQSGALGLRQNELGPRHFVFGRRPPAEPQPRFAHRQRHPIVVLDRCRDAGRFAWPAGRPLCESGRKAAWASALRAEIDVVDVAAGAVGHDAHERRVEAIGRIATAARDRRTRRSNRPKRRRLRCRQRSAANSWPTAPAAAQSAARTREHADLRIDRTRQARPDRGWPPADSSSRGRRRPKGSTQRHAVLHLPAAIENLRTPRGQRPSRSWPARDYARPGESRRKSAPRGIPNSAGSGSL